MPAASHARTHGPVSTGSLQSDHSQVISAYLVLHAGQPQSVGELLSTTVTGTNQPSALVKPGEREGTSVTPCIMQGEVMGLTRHACLP